MHPNNKTDRLREQLLTEGVIWKQLVFFSIPIMVGTLFQQLYNMIDAIVVGNFVGITALAAVGGSTQHRIDFGIFSGGICRSCCPDRTILWWKRSGEAFGRITYNDCVLHCVRKITFLDGIFSGTSFFALDEYTGRHDAGSCPLFENLFCRCAIFYPVLRRKPRPT